MEQQYSSPMVWYCYPQTTGYLPAYVYPQYIPLLLLPPPPSPAPLYSLPSNGAEVNSHADAQQQFSQRHPWHGKAKDEKRRAKRKAKRQRRAERKKALYEAAAKAKADDRDIELADALENLDIGSHRREKEKCRAGGTGVDTPPDSLQDATDEDFEEEVEDGGSEASDYEDDECKPYIKLGLKCCAEHGKGCWRFPDLLAMKRYLPTWRGLKTGDESRALRKYSM
ncbi:hypothetical protein SVAN01_08243 [Stagonosporopsis vannaccii]|nr:hypothetical protein SVAN01_08243 [Stagonosporopsis vannaccii]